MKPSMKIMMDLLIGLQRLERAVETACQQRQLTPREAQALEGHLGLVREIVPNEVLAFYDEMKRTDKDLAPSPELFSMAVLVATYRSLSPQKRRKLLTHFSMEPGLRSFTNHSGTRSVTPAGKLWQRAARQPLRVRN